MMEKMSVPAQIQYIKRRFTDYPADIHQASSEVKSNVDFAYWVASNYPLALRYFNNELSSDKKLIMLAISNLQLTEDKDNRVKAFVEYISMDFRNSEEFILEAIEKQPLLFRPLYDHILGNYCGSNTVSDHKDFLLEGVRFERIGKNYSEISSYPITVLISEEKRNKGKGLPSLLADKDFAMACIKITPKSILSFLNSVRYDQEVLGKAISLSNDIQEIIREIPPALTLAPAILESAIKRDILGSSKFYLDGTAVNMWNNQTPMIKYLNSLDDQETITSYLKRIASKSYHFHKDIFPYAEREDIPYISDLLVSKMDNEHLESFNVGKSFYLQNVIDLRLAKNRLLAIKQEGKAPLLKKRKKVGLI